MTELVFFLVAGFFLLLLFLVAFLGTWPRPQALDSLPYGKLQEILPLQGLSFHDADRLFDDRDYLFLQSRPALHEVTRQLRSERKKIVLVWLAHLQNDTLKLWQFRRFLARNGAATGLVEDLRLTFCFTLTISLLAVLRVVVGVVGPFRVRKLLRATSEKVQTGSYACAGLLGRLSDYTRLEQKWKLEQETISAK